MKQFKTHLGQGQEVTDIMDTKQYLKQIERLEKQIQNKLAEIYQLKTMACSVTVSNSDGERVQTSSDKDRLGSTVAKIVDLEKETDRLVDEYVKLKKEVIKEISMLNDNKQKYILFQKYIRYKSIYAIAEELKMTDRGCKKTHKRALEEFGKINKNKIYCIILDSSLLDVVK